MKKKGRLILGVILLIIIFLTICITCWTWKATNSSQIEENTVIKSDELIHSESTSNTSSTEAHYYEGK